MGNTLKPTSLQYKERHQLLAEKFATTQEVIGYIRGYQSNQENIRIFSDYLEEKIAKKNQDIVHLKGSISRRQTNHQEVNPTLETDLKNLSAKRDFLLDVYTFVHKLTIQQWISIREGIVPSA